SRGIVAGAQTDPNFKLTTPDEAEARAAVKSGRTAAAIVIPHGFGEASGQAFFGQGDKPALDVLFDPSRSIEVAMVRGILTQHVMEAVSREMFGGEQGRAIVERTLPQVEQSSMPAEQKRALVDML